MHHLLGTHRRPIEVSDKCGALCCGKSRMHESFTGMGSLVVQKCHCCRIECVRELQQIKEGPHCRFFGNLWSDCLHSRTHNLCTRKEILAQTTCTQHLRLIIGEIWVHVIRSVQELTGYPRSVVVHKCCGLEQDTSAIRNKNSVHIDVIIFSFVAGWFRIFLFRSFVVVFVIIFVLYAFFESHHVLEKPEDHVQRGRWQRFTLKFMTEFACNGYKIITTKGIAHPKTLQ